RVPLASGGTAGRSPEGISSRIRARSSPWFIREEQQEGGHGPPRNTDARLDRATVRPGLELAGLSTLQHDRLACGTLPSAAPPLLVSAPRRFRFQAPAGPLAPKLMIDA